MATFLIIGGSSTVGTAIVHDLLSNGHKVFASYFCTPIEFQHPKLTSFKWDVHSEWLEEIIQDDEIDGFVYCPGAINLKPFHRSTLKEFHDDLDLQVFGAIRVLQGNLQKLKKNRPASVVLISSIAVQRGFPFHSIIGVSKGAIEGLIKNLAAELAPQIRVNGVAPSIVDSRMSSRLLNSDEKRAMLASNHPLKRIGKPQDICKIVTFLLSEDSSWITGQVVRVDGGKSNLL